MFKKFIGSSVPEN